MQTNIFFSPTESSVYPGEYEAPKEVIQLKDELQKAGSIIRPPVSVKRFTNYYKIEVFAPGFSRSDFIIDTKGHNLTIRANSTLNVVRNIPGKEHGFHIQCIQRQLTLPPDVDTEFVSAEYSEGILSIFLFRNSQPVSNQPGKIVVY